MSKNATNEPDGVSETAINHGASFTQPETSVPAGEQPDSCCPYCGRPFTTEQLCALHVGEVHPERCTNAEREAYERARQDEDDELFLFHFKVVGALGVTYALFVLAYMVVLSG